MQEYLIHACHTESSSSAPEELIPASVPELLASRGYSRRLNFKEYPPNVLLMRRCIRPLHLLLASFTVLRLSTARKHPSLYFASSSHVFPHSSKSFLPLSFYSSLPSVCALLLSRAGLRSIKQFLFPIPRESRSFSLRFTQSLASHFFSAKWK